MNLKVLLTKLITQFKKQSVKIVAVTATSGSISATTNSTLALTPSLPTNYKIRGVLGWRITAVKASGGANIVCARLVGFTWNDSTLTAYFRNTNSEYKIKVTIYARVLAVHKSFTN